MKLIELIESVRVYCGRPAHDTLDNGAILTVLQGRINYYRGLLGQTNQDWLIETGYLNVNPNQNEYDVGIENFSRPIKVEYYDPTRPWANGPEIPMILLQDSDLVGASDNYLYAGANTNGQDEGAFIASAIAFYDLNQKVRVIPRPYQPVRYKIYYEPATVDEPGLLDEPRFPRQFHDMLALSAAKLCFGMARQDGPGMNMLIQSVMSSLMQQEKSFDDFRRMAKHSDTKRRRPFRPSWNQGGY